MALQQPRGGVVCRRLNRRWRLLPGIVVTERLLNLPLAIPVRKGISPDGFKQLLELFQLSRGVGVRHD